MLKSFSLTKDLCKQHNNPSICEQFPSYEEMLLIELDFGACALCMQHNYCSITRIFSIPRNFLIFCNSIMQGCS